MNTDGCTEGDLDDEDEYVECDCCCSTNNCYPFEEDDDD